MFLVAPCASQHVDIINVDLEAVRFKLRRRGICSFLSGALIFDVLVLKFLFESWGFCVDRALGVSDILFAPGIIRPHHRGVGKEKVYAREL